MFLNKPFYYIWIVVQQAQAFGKIANFVVNSRLRFARNSIFNRKQLVPNFTTSSNTKRTTYIKSLPINPSIMKSLQNSIVPFFFLLFSIGNVNGQTSSSGDTYILKADDFKKQLKMDSAVFYYEKAAVAFQRIKEYEKLIDSYNQLGIIVTRQDKYDKAKMYLEKALSAGLSLPDNANLVIATTYISLGVVYNAEENYNESLKYHNKALSIRLLKLGENDATVATSYGNLGNVYRNNKNFDKSIEAHLKAMKIREKLFGLNSVEIIESYVGLGNTYKEEKKYTISLGYFEKALENKIIQRGEGHKDLVKFYKYISDVYFLMENKWKGDEYKIKWEEIEKKSSNSQKQN
ncbi:MAG: tetratricopeptide repeat protein [Flavobacterium sp.]